MTRYLLHLQKTKRVFHSISFEYGPNRWFWESNTIHIFFANSTRCRTTFDFRLHCKSTSFTKQSVHCLTLLTRKSRKLAANFFAGPSPTHFKKFTIGCPPWLWPWSGERDVMSGGSLFPTAGLQEGGGEQREVRMFSMFQCSGCCPRDGEQGRLLLLLDRWVPTF